MELLAGLDGDISRQGLTPEAASCLLRAHLAAHLATLNLHLPGTTADGEIDRLRFHIAIRTERGRPHAAFWRDVWSLMNAGTPFSADPLL